MVEIKWIGRRWYEFRMGYQTYMVFLFGFSNFILILYNFAPQFKEMMPIHYFVVISFVIIVPIAITIGRYHNKSQVPTESKIQTAGYAYRDVIVPNSKEIFAAKATIFSLDLSSWQIEYNKWQLALNKKQFKIINALAEKAGITDTFTSEDFSMIDRMSLEFDKLAAETNVWKMRNKQYLEGEEASKLANT